jgi:hypothetical protein
MTALTPRQSAMLCASEPDDITGEDGAGVELKTGADYAVARALERRWFGWVEGPGGSFVSLYFNNSEGMRARADIMDAPQ